MDDVSRAEARGWREALAAKAPLGVVFYSPAHAYLNVRGTNFPKADRANRLAICHGCDGVLANLSGEGQGFGTIREIEYARMSSKPVAVVGKIQSMMKTDLMVADDLEAALTMLLEAIQEDRDMPHPLAQLFGIGGPDAED